ncbi:MAG: ribbon-helix-helix protein, CopG family [Jannaschia sp.]
MAANQPVAVKLDLETRARLKILATVRDRSAHWLMREAIAQYVEREEQRESFRQDALRAWENYQADGLHVMAEEADAWLSRLEAGEETDLPEAHR